MKLQRLDAVFFKHFESVDLLPNCGVGSTI